MPPREGGPALIVQHCAVSGRLETPVRTWRVSDVRHQETPWRPAQPDEYSLHVTFQEPRQRRRYIYSIKSDNLRYLTIEVGAQTVYDSRAEVPCDMAAWEGVNTEWRTRRPLQVVHHDH